MAEGEALCSVHPGIQRRHMGEHEGAHGRQRRDDHRVSLVRPHLRLRP